MSGIAPSRNGLSEPAQGIEPGDNATSLNPGSGGVLGRIVMVCGATTTGAGALMLIGWVLGSDALTTMGTGYIPMAPNTALLFALLGSAMLMREVWPASGASHHAATAAALFSAGVAGVTLSGFTVGLNVDDWLFHTTRRLGEVQIGHMSPVTAFCFVLAGVSLLLSECKARTCAAVLGILIALTGAVCLIGYLFGAPLLYGGAVIPVALPTSLALLALGVGLTAAQGPDIWPLNTLTGPATRARLLRALLPTVVLLALINSWITAILLEHVAPSVVLAAAMTAISFLLVVSYAVTRLSRTIGDAIDRTEAERERAEKMLRESEGKLRSIFDGALDGILVADKETRKFLSGNPAICRMLGYTLEEIVRIGVSDIHPKQDLSHAMEQFERQLRGESQVAADIPVMRKDGSVFYADIKAAPIRLGGKDGLLGIFRDITERKNQEQRIARLSRIQAVMSAINSLIVRVRDRQELFNEACRIAVEHGGFGIAWIGRLDPETLTVTPAACAGVAAGSFPISSQNTARADSPMGQGIVGRAIREKRAVFSNNLIAETSMGGERRKVAVGRGYLSVIALPLLVEGAAVGNFSLFAKEANFFTADELELLTELAGDISFALQSIARQEKLEKLSRIRAVSGGINAAIVRIRERDALLRETCRIATELGKFELVWIGSLDPEKQEVQPVAWSGFSPDAAHAVNWATIDAARGTLGKAIQTGRPALNNDLEGGVQGGLLRQEAISKGCLSSVTMPLVVDDRVVAICALFAPGKGFFDPDELALLGELAADVSFALAYIAKEEQLNYLAYYDALTGLPNRTLFCDRVDSFVRLHAVRQESVAVVTFNVERFRFVNDSFGRQAGDTLLKQIAERLLEAVGNDGNVARTGSNSFAVSLAGVTAGANVARTLEEKLFYALSRPFTVSEQELRLSFKCGVALSPEDGNDAESLFRNAEAALQKAKGSGDKYMFYAPQMNARVAEILSLENKLRIAIVDEQFVLHYQPKIDLISNRVVGLEALIRWESPETGLIPPAQFIPILEETGMILEVGQWVLQQAAEDQRQWRKQGLNPPRIAVNISSLQLRQKGFVDSILKVIAADKDNPAELDIEITESVVMQDIEESILKLNVIKAMGVGIEIDDFGTGYSSLSYIARLPITALKIDRSFITEMANSDDNMMVTSTIISLAHALKLRVVAEGVETEEQREILKLLKCDEMQGFLYSRPVPADVIEARLTA